MSACSHDVISTPVVMNQTPKLLPEDSEKLSLLIDTFWVWSYLLHQSSVLTRIYRPKGTNNILWPCPSSWI